MQYFLLWLLEELQPLPPIIALLQLISLRQLLIVWKSYGNTTRGRKLVVRHKNFWKNMTKLPLYQIEMNFRSWEGTDPYWKTIPTCFVILDFDHHGILWTQCWNLRQHQIKNLAIPEPHHGHQQISLQRRPLAVGWCLQRNLKWNSPLAFLQN